MIIHTEAGKAIFITQLTKLTNSDIVNEGSIALFILLNSDDKPECYVLLWEWGGDWMCFGDGDEHDKEKLIGWEPSKIYAAIYQARKLNNEYVNGDMGWFEDWAHSAEKTLEGI